MPTYDYVCTACDHRFEEFQAMTAKALKKCPACGRPKLERKIGTGAGVLFKGGGFYETDYRSDSYKKAAEADAKPAESKGDAAPNDATSRPKPERKQEPNPRPTPESTPESKPESKVESRPVPKAAPMHAVPASKPRRPAGRGR